MSEGAEYTRGLNIPILTEVQKELLVSFGSAVVEQARLIRFDTFEEWQNRTSVNSHNRGFFTSIERDTGIFSMYRELQPYQRFDLLQHNNAIKLGGRVEEADTGPLDTETDEMLWMAYENMADLTDISDVYFDRDENGLILPNSLMI